MTTEEMVEELDDAGRIFDCELGEYWGALAQLVSVYKNGATDEFAAALEKEIQEQHTLLKEDFRLVETEVIHKVIEQRLVHFTECAE